MIQVLDSTIHQKDMVFFSNKGVFFETYENNKMLVVSQTNTLTIFIDARQEENIRFKARFKRGMLISLKKKG